jgi:hypothetical protein
MVNSRRVRGNPTGAAMTVYVNAHMIPVGQWMFYPEWMFARNMHNGTVARFIRTTAGGWQVACVECPADWMLVELAVWFQKWMGGGQ